MKGVYAKTRVFGHDVENVDFFGVFVIFFVFCVIAVAFSTDASSCGNLGVKRQGGHGRVGA